MIILQIAVSKNQAAAAVVLQVFESRACPLERNSVRFKGHR